MLFEVVLQDDMATSLSTIGTTHPDRVIARMKTEKTFKVFTSSGLYECYFWAQSCASE
jgi:hypothetical protein